jgi:hypothetical protein
MKVASARQMTASLFITHGYWCSSPSQGRCFLLSSRGGEGKDGGVSKFLGEHCWPYLLRADQAVDCIVAAIFGRFGGPFSTSFEEALLILRRSSTPLILQVVLSPELLRWPEAAILRRRNILERFFSDLDAGHVEVIGGCGRGTIGLDCFLLFLFQGVF